jgi:hypothetical protein
VTRARHGSASLLLFLSGRSASARIRPAFSLALSLGAGEGGDGPGRVSMQRRFAAFRCTFLTAPTYFSTPPPDGSRKGRCASE